MPKFMQSFTAPVFEKLTAMADKDGLTIQELIRARIVHDWIEWNEGLAKMRKRAWQKGYNAGLKKNGHARTHPKTQ